MGLRRDALPVCFICRTKGWPSRRPPAIRVRGHTGTKRHDRAAHWIPPEARWRGRPRRHYRFDQESYDAYCEEQFYEKVAADPAYAAEWLPVIEAWRQEPAG